jgi:hypothetical protein
MTVQKREIQYVVLPNADEPFLLARVRWPDIYQAISPVRTDWQDDPGLFDLPYAPTSTAVTLERAAEIAAAWGARIPTEADEPHSGPSLIRRMPSDWSKLTTAERRAWSIVDVRSASTRRQWLRRRAKPELERALVEPVVLGSVVLGSVVLEVSLPVTELELEAAAVESLVNELAPPREHDLAMVDHS